MMQLANICSYYSCFIVLLLFVGTCVGVPIAPTTRDGATPIDAQVSAADFGVLDAFAEDAAESAQIEQKSRDLSSASATVSNEGAFKISLLPTPAKTAESVNLEHEAIPSKVLGVYDNGHKKLSDISHPLPILDTISEHEKYGNNGDMFDGISRSIVNGYEAFSNLLNSFIEKPKELARTISKGITAQLDIIGGKLVGL
ncbi:uncharacterized protein LOC115628952 [Scaptodrosophila lebanonensis]|uniref:Uncharacterized protein LOC115628952 n=1 Tax=Drosophila lebanonensis TaxID=7225 RepID=A0A6J2U0U2_DROLE|nr:uncharacterized protein LOC115628952 [Scaptodrosophila lebanonensis]